MKKHKIQKDVKKKDPSYSKRITCSKGPTNILS